MARRITLDVRKFVPNPGAPTVAPKIAGVGTVNIVAGAALADSDYFTVNDGEHAALAFEFDIAGDGVTGGRRAVAVTGASTAAQVKAAVIAAINAARDAGLLNLTATDTGAAQVTVTMNDSTAGAALTENVADAGFTVSGMAAPVGATSHGYKIVGIAADGTLTAASAETVDVAGPATLDASHLEHITWTDPLNAAQVKIYRTTGGATQGLIATVLAGVQVLDDTGLVATVETPSATNGTGVGDRSKSVLDLVNKYMQVTGTFVGTWQLQGSIDGASWVNIGAAFNATGLTAIAPTVEFLRVVGTAYTSGAAAVAVAGNAER